jgi:3-(3-hydroxy-phenyl)propionate hydroxylase
MHFNNAAGETLLIRGGTAARGPHGCANNHYFHQPELEQVLREGLPALAQCAGLLQLHEVTASRRRRRRRDAAGPGPRHGPPARCRRAMWWAATAPARWCARPSAPRMADLGLHQPWLVFDVRLKAEAPNLPYTVQHCDPARPMTYCNVTGNRRRWEIMLMPGDDPADTGAAGHTSGA